MKFIKILTVLIVVFFSTFSCITQKDYVLLRKTGNYDSTFVPKYTPYKIQQNDILSISVVSTDPESSRMFTKESGARGNNALSEMSTYLHGFALNDSGNIIIPIMGDVKALGLTVNELRDTLQHKMNMYFKFAVVDVKIANYRLTFMGEFQNSGPLLVYRNRINLIEALALSGGFSDFARRSNVIIYRNINGQTHIRKVDFTSIDLVNHEWFYLMPNDVLYAEPVRIKALKVNATTISFITTVISFGLLLINLSNRYK